MMKNNLMYLFCLGFVICGFWNTALAVRINDIVMPEVVEAHLPILLDCDYILDETNDDALVVKWFFGNDPTLVYQWIPNHPPVALGILKGRLNLNYEADSNPNYRHRALQILNPTSELTGKYTCKVSTLTSEDSLTKIMTVFVRPSSFESEYKTIGLAKYEISCEANGVSPMPVLSISLGNRILNATTTELIAKNNAFDIKSTAIVKIHRCEEEFSCQLEVQKANFISIKKGLLHSCDSGCSTLQITSFYAILIINLIFFFIAHH